MRENELKKCPFCGEKAAFRTTGSLYSNAGVGFSFEIKCTGCGVSLPGKQHEVKFSLDDDGSINPFRDDRAEAIAEWNNRILH